MANTTPSGPPEVAAALCCVMADVRRIVADDGRGRVHFLSLELKKENGHE
jgi:hypothetical protein